MLDGIILKEDSHNDLIDDVEFVFYESFSPHITLRDSVQLI